MSASVSMPAPVIVHAISAGNAPVFTEIVCGSEKMPPPIIEPRTSAISATSPSVVCLPVSVCMAVHHRELHRDGIGLRRRRHHTTSCSAAVTARRALASFLFQHVDDEALALCRLPWDEPVHLD